MPWGPPVIAVIASTKGLGGDPEWAVTPAVRSITQSLPQRNYIPRRVLILHPRKLANGTRRGAFSPCGPTAGRPKEGLCSLVLSWLNSSGHLLGHAFQQPLIGHIG